MKIKMSQNFKRVMSTIVLFCGDNRTFLCWQSYVSVATIVRYCVENRTCNRTWCCDTQITLDDGLNLSLTEISNITYCHRLSSIFAWKFAKNMLPKKNSRKHQPPRDKKKRKSNFDEKKIKITKENTEVNKTSNQRKCTKSDQENWKQIKNFNK